ncbi:class I SAM-dependent methyltransferase [Candidatus Bathyarchaeota archaeon]|nr:class I SAM-dependent methyltransferase [Candidatus Bathyarchaeota archaeon]
MRYGIDKCYQFLKRALLQAILVHGSVLDVGCGKGSFPLSRDIVGVDVDKNLLLYCLYEFKVRADARYLPFKDKSFDVVLEMGCLPYIKDWAKALNEMKRVGRRVYLIEPLRRKGRRHWFSFSDLIKMGFPVFFILRTFVIKVKN